ncbi:E3 ubiquitin-protein ligase BRE1, partial [Lecanoromycetidae sp. Uapishka_2]
MEERKRPASHDHDVTEPPLKRQATSVNGTPKGHIDADMPWKDDLEQFQKEAIYRQMQEYKRDRNSLEARLKDMGKKGLHHDEHLMLIDAWFAELLDEVRLLIGDFSSHTNYSPFPSALLSSDSGLFKDHLKSRSKEISTAISQLFSRAPSSAPETSQYQSRIAQLLEAEKGHLVELEKSGLEKEKLVERLEDASLRYMIAEKKLDRAKSATVARLERQAQAGGQNESGSGLGGSGQDGTNGRIESKGASGEELLEAEEARKVAVIESAKRKEQLESLEAENEKLTTQLTALNSRLSHLSDDDYSKTDLFKQLKSQHEDVIKRINNLEATNVQLQEEAKELRAERTAYSVQLEKESQIAIAEREAHLAQAENDLARIRSGRDELIAEVQMRKTAQSQERTSIEHIKEFAGAKEERIKALESEIARLKLQTGQSEEHPSPPSGLDGLSTEELQSRYSNLEKQYSLLNNELQSMGTAFKKTSALASQKVSNLSFLEEKSIRLSAEKARADQKYFSAMKAKEAREQEVRTLRAQNNKSSEMVSSLKDSEAANRAVQVNLEKQLAEIRESLNGMETKHRASQQQLAERSIVSDGLKAQVEELKKSLETKDTSASATSIACRRAEVEVETLKVRLEETQKSLEMWKSKGLGNESGEYEMLRIMALCTVCHKNFKNTVIKTCGHLFCNECVEERTSNRYRKCPNCNKSFGTGDAMHITL